MMLKLFVGAGLLVTAACSKPEDPNQANIAVAAQSAEPELRNQLAAAKREIEGLKIQAAVYKETAENLKKEMRRADSGEMDAGTTAAMCWQDYCPCDEVREMDRMLCRNLKGGIAVSSEQMAAAAAMRDGNDALDKWERERDY